MAKQFGISRSTLLYYERIGLLKPGGRSNANYRLYNDKDVKKLRRIMRYREAGLPLAAVGELISGKMRSPEKDSALDLRLEQINSEIANLRKQQHIILQLLGKAGSPKRARILTKASWVSLLKATGLNEHDMHRWHIEFEKMSPEAHQDFLEFLGLSSKKISEIRTWSGKE